MTVSKTVGRGSNPCGPAHQNLLCFSFGSKQGDDGESGGIISKKEEVSLKEIFNVYVTCPFDFEGKDKDLLEHYSPIALLISEISIPPLEQPEKDAVYQVKITRIDK